MTNPTEELAFQTERAEKAQAELQTFKKQAKELQQFLEGEATKKQAQIRKLKEQSIMKEKNYKLQKMELTQLQSQNAALKEQVASSQHNKADASLLNKLEGEIQALKKVEEELKKEIQRQKQKALGYQANYKKIEAESKSKQASLKDELEHYKHSLQQVKNNNEDLKKANEQLKKLNDDLKKGKPLKQSQIQRKSSKKDIKFMKESVERDRSEEIVKQLQEANQRLKQSFIKGEKTIKQLKSKNQVLSEQNEQLQSKILLYSKINTVSQSSFNSSPFTIKTIIEQEPDTSINKIHYSCLLLTKPHYISPFLEIVQDKSMVKIYKSTRTGTFQKSVGYYKHKFDNLTFDQEQLIEPIVKTIIQSEEISSHSVVLFGVKKSNKKYIMSKMLAKLKEFILEKLQEEEPSCTFIKRSQEEEKNSTENGDTKEKIIQLIDKVIGIGVKSEKGKEKYGPVKKVQSRPKIRYFNFKTSSFNLQISTSSYTSLTFRDKMTSNNMFNNILYSKLPDILQSSISQKYLVLTLNPIVDLYEDCKNTLSTTFCRAVESKQDENRQWKPSPIKEELNDIAKKKLQNFERENQQTSIKIRKLQDDCSYYKSRFDQLEFRLKNLLNTHAGQNSYLKKSPITLSYEKLLKFVHSVQGRSLGSLNSSQYGSTSMLLKSSNMNIEKEQMDAL